MGSGVKAPLSSLYGYVLRCVAWREVGSRATCRDARLPAHDYKACSRSSFTTLVPQRSFRNACSATLVQQRSFRNPLKQRSFHNVRYAMLDLF